MLAGGDHPIKILFLSNYYPPYEVGGYEQLCRDVAIRLKGRNHEITVLTSDHGARKKDKLQEEGVLRWLRIRPQKESNLSIAAQFFLTRRSAEKFNRRVFHNVVDQISPDIIFIWNLQGLPQELSLDAEASGIPVAYWLAGYAPAEPDLFWRYWAQPPMQRHKLATIKGIIRKIAFAQMRREGKPVHPRLRHVAVVSEYMCRIGLEQNTIPANAEVIYNGVEARDFFRPVPPPDASPPINILLAGRVTPDKGIHVAIEALAMVAQNSLQQNFRLIIAGGGSKDYLRELKQLSRAMGVEGLVKYLGWLPREQIPSLMHNSHILLLPSIFPEAFSRVILEGMAAGLAVIATLNGGTGELLEDKVNGLTCEVGNSHEMAENISLLLKKPRMRYQLACAGQRRVLEEFSLDVMVDRLENFLERGIPEYGEQSDN